MIPDDFGKNNPLVKHREKCPAKTQLRLQDIAAVLRDVLGSE